MAKNKNKKDNKPFVYIDNSPYEEFLVSTTQKSFIRKYILGKLQLILMIVVFIIAIIFSMRTGTDVPFVMVLLFFLVYAFIWKKF
jgi:hypothetical protein